MHMDGMYLQYTITMHTKRYDSIFICQKALAFPAWPEASVFECEFPERYNLGCFQRE